MGCRTVQMISYYYIPNVTVTTVFTEAEMSLLSAEVNSLWTWKHLSF